MRFPRSVAFAAVFTTALAPASAQLGSIDPPPGPIDETMKPLDVVEARTPVGPETTPGDAGSVYVIDEPGSYYLVENLVGVSGQSGIRVEADNVTLDLNGFVVDGNSVGLTGIDAAAFPETLVVKNGTVRDWTGDGVDLRSDSAVASDLRLIGNARWGIDAEGAFGVQIRDRIARDNGDPQAPARTGGFRVPDGSTIINSASRDDVHAFVIDGVGVVLENCVSSRAAADAFLVNQARGAVFRACTAEDGDANGFRFEIGSVATLHGCVATGNGADGFSAPEDPDRDTTLRFDACSAVGNAGDGFDIDTANARFDRCIATKNGAAGFSAGQNALLIECTASENTGSGMTISVGSRITGGSADFNDGGGVFLFQDATVEDIELTNNTGQGITANSGCVVRNCDIEGSSRAVTVVGACVLIENNTISTNLEGVVILGAASDTVVIRNRFRGLFGAEVNTTTGQRVAPIVLPDAAVTNPLSNITY